MTPELTIAEWWERCGRPRRAVAVVAHPDDESFGLGAVIAGLVDAGADVDVVCLTRGEASTLGVVDDLGSRRDGELQAASGALGVAELHRYDFPDGNLADVDDAVLDSVLDAHVRGADLVVVFEPGGVTGHPDHRAATAAGERVAARLGIPVAEWGVSPSVAAALRDELGVTFVAFEGANCDIVDLVVDRRRQLAAIDCHASQAGGNVVLERRLRRQGHRERLGLLQMASSTPPAG